jgi:hypothetical protein
LLADKSKYRPNASLTTRSSTTYIFSAAMEGTFPSDFVVEARAMPLPSPTSIANAATKRRAAILTACYYHSACVSARVCPKGPKAFTQWHVRSMLNVPGPNMSARVCHVICI